MRKGIVFLALLSLCGCTRQKDIEPHDIKSANSALEVESSAQGVSEQPVTAEERGTTQDAVTTSECSTTQEWGTSKVTTEVTTETPSEEVTTQVVTTEIQSIVEIPKPKLEIEKSKDGVSVVYGDISMKFPRTVKLNDIDFSKDGNSYGSLRIPSAGIDTSIIKGASQSLVDDYDVCISTDYSFCGSPKPVLLCGHKTKSFSKLYEVKVGDYIFIETSYGGYVYEVTKTQVGTVTSDCTNILDDTGKGIIVKNKEYRSQPLQIYTCYGQDRGTQRFVVNAKWITGTKIK